MNIRGGINQIKQNPWDAVSVGSRQFEVRNNSDIKYVLAYFQQHFSLFCHFAFVAWSPSFHAIDSFIWLPSASTGVLGIYIARLKIVCEMATLCYTTNAPITIVGMLEMMNIKKHFFHGIIGMRATWTSALNGLSLPSITNFLATRSGISFPMASLVSHSYSYCEIENFTVDCACRCRCRDKHKCRDLFSFWILLEFWQFLIIPLFF